MPLSTNLPTDKVVGDPGHVDGHSATNTRVNEVATEVNAHETDLGSLRTQLFGGSARTAKPLLQLKLASAQAISANTGTTLTSGMWTTIKDTDSIWASSTATIPATGIYKARLLLAWEADNVGSRWSYILLNGTNADTDIIGFGIANPTVGWETENTAEVVGAFTVGDVLRVGAFHDSTAPTLDLLSTVYGPAASTFTLEWVGPS